MDKALLSKVITLTNPPHQPVEWIGVAASAGGLNAISMVLAGLPADFPSAVLIVQHLGPNRPTTIDKIFKRRTPLDVKLAQLGETIIPGRVYIAPPDHHLMVTAQRTIHLSQESRVHFLRPCADVLFASMAEFMGPKCAVVVLSGSGTDGSEGIAKVKRSGGLAIAQDPETAQFPGMPASAVHTGLVDLILPLEDISSALTILVSKGMPS